MTKTESRGPGRPPSGPDGERVSRYPQLTIRLPAETKAKLSTLSLLTATPIWRLIDSAVDTYVRHLPEPEKSRLGEIADRLVRGDWPVTSHWEPTFKAWKAKSKATQKKATRPTKPR